MEKECLLKFFYLDYISGYNLISIILNFPINLTNYLMNKINKDRKNINKIKIHLDYYPINKFIHILYSR